MATEQFGVIPSFWKRMETYGIITTVSLYISDIFLGCIHHHLSPTCCTFSHGNSTSAGLANGYMVRLKMDAILCNLCTFASVPKWPQNQPQSIHFLKISWGSMPPDSPSPACLCMYTYITYIHVTPLLKILATGLPWFHATIFVSWVSFLHNMHMYRLLWHCSTIPLISMSEILWFSCS